MKNEKYTFWRKDTFSQKKKGGIFTSKKVYPNDSCPCGSGKKYKLCCKGKQDDVDFVNPLNLLDNYKRIRKESRIKQCLHPNNEECSEKIIGAHSIQNNKILKRISSNGMVFMPCPKPDNPFAPMTSYGRKEATVFTGFCGHHDKTLFQPIEDRDFEKTEEQVFLYTYRCFALEYHKKQEVKKMEQIIFTKRPSLVNMPDAEDPFKGNKMAIEDFIEDKKIFDKAILEKDYSVLTSIIWEFDKAVKFACTGFEALQYDLNNRRVQDLLDFSKPAQHVYVCVFPENEKTYCIISWFKKNDGMFSSYYEQLNGLDEVKKRNFINNLLPMISESLVVNPEAWEKLSQSQKNEFGSYVWGIETIAQEMGIKVDRTEAPSYDMFEL